MLRARQPSAIADCLADGQHSGAADVLFRLLVSNGYPISASIAVTECCNLQCPHCFVPRPEQENPLELAKLVVLFDELKSLGVLHLTLTGGEPALRRDLVGIVAAARDRRFGVTLKTNGTILSERVLHGLREAGLHRIDASLYHDRADEHDEFVGMRGAWLRTVNSLDQWVTLGGSSALSFVAMNWNSDRVESITELARSHGFNYRVSPIVNCRTDGDLAPVEFRLGRDKFVSLLGEESLLDPAEFDSAVGKSPEQSVCTGGLNLPHIGPSGRVYICQNYPEVMGSLREQTFREIWDKSPIRRKFIETKWQNLPVCSVCEISWACERCPASALLENGDFFGPSGSNCLLAEAKSIVVGRPGKPPAESRLRCHGTKSHE